ncbi:MAG: antitoxin [Candidatus Nealsonbacteria bacterium CG02_land_8_20_14_3_00_37_10]|jgi:mannitol/fructose-specific phosphotransferase system IIA component|uniref:Antitoxin n=1 Tax=Candidatus Nealsonbacteria bacterium CG02_land_8_20_14_3_00_37_10 TaxID=1974699 RepID=A0A2M7D9E1_9BACT|nr:MAG: antitoxin [Candidatus Woesearchaeota archaeon CG07_land_8_20_14_0_80_44_23]PIV45061.1 MAG: antitoxin [Candidatus Nealsonbacteria bacterium CG02_land_8_20_14_3_00_37_10]
MVMGMIDISPEANQVLNIVKAKFGLKDKSEAIEQVVLQYQEEILEPELRPEFINKMMKRQKEGTVRIKDFKKHFGMR